MVRTVHHALSADAWGMSSGEGQAPDGDVLTKDERETRDNARALDALAAAKRAADVVARVVDELPAGRGWRGPTPCTQRCASSPPGPSPRSGMRGAAGRGNLASTDSTSVTVRPSWALPTGAPCAISTTPTPPSWHARGRAQNQSSTRRPLAACLSCARCAARPTGSSERPPGRWSSRPRASQASARRRRASCASYSPASSPRSRRPCAEGPSTLTQTDTTSPTRSS